MKVFDGLVRAVALDGTVWLVPASDAASVAKFAGVTKASKALLDFNKNDPHAHSAK